MSASEIFDRNLRRLRRDRAAADFAAHGFARDRMADELLARLELVTRDFRDALDLGCADGRIGRALVVRGLRITSCDAGFRFAEAAGGVQCDEDRLPFADGSFDLVLSAGGLDQVNDLPGALTLIRRILRPDGLFLAAFAGAGTLTRTRALLLEADAAGAGASSRVHPQIDVRAAGDLLARAGFALPVADGEQVAVRYDGLYSLLADLRGTAATNLLREARAPLGRIKLGRVATAFAAAADRDGRTSEPLNIVYLAGWAPSPDQPVPARRGSGVQSLATALNRANR